MALSDNIRGAALMAGAMSAFTVNDTFIKLLSGTLPLGQVIVLRTAVVIVAFAAAAVLTGAFRKRLSGRDWGLLLLRGGAEALAAYFFLTALFHMDISALSAILQALPLTVTLGAALAFREPVGWRRFAAIGVGLIGVMLIIRPGGESFTVYSLYGVATVVLASVRDLTTRRLSRDVPSMTAALVTALAVVALGGLMSASGEPWAAVNLRSALLLAGASTMIFAAYFAIVAAMRVGEVGFVAPFRYTSLVVAVVAGVLVFGERPDALTLLGMAIVVGSGMYTLWREQQLRRRIAARSGGRGAMT